MKNSLVLALLLVLAMGSMALAAPPADFGALPNHLGVSQSAIPIELYVEKFAYVGDIDTTPLKFHLNAPSSTGDTDPRLTREIEFAANTGVNVVLEEDITKAIYDSIPSDEVDKAGLPIHVYLSLKDRTPVGDLDVGAFANGGVSGARNTFAFTPGKYTETVVLGYGWNAFRGGGNASDKSWKDYAWWLIENNTYTGHLTVTVSAQQ